MAPNPVQISQIFEGRNLRESPRPSRPCPAAAPPPSCRTAPGFADTPRQHSVFLCVCEGRARQHLTRFRGHDCQDGVSMKDETASTACTMTNLSVSTCVRGHTLSASRTTCQHSVVSSVFGRTWQFVVSLYCARAATTDKRTATKQDSHLAEASRAPAALPWREKKLLPGGAGGACGAASSPSAKSCPPTF